uniref:Uncharacterized protein n=1 Tax=Stomoxys calcitrans TaxID=35570 RepID=A0A1I8PKT5_STOCA|nr:unnamed protein product [Stomoxys calcitrans]XP_013102609.1 unnamed protein product [Stomoxys calcitrans]XP_013102617.1 unnamed protein product [Stomoxys calcitrans]XP_013102626.1 unnamed protein product [Stomoxys calcitrans]
MATAVNTSVLNNTTGAPPATTNPHELALQSLCKQILKSRLFRGFYEERRYVDNVSGYRDIVSLHRSEKELHKLLKDIRDKLEMFYSQQNPNMWIGISCVPLGGGFTPSPGALDTFIWAEVDDLAFGQYWFSIKSLRFRGNEVILKLKTVRSVEAEELSEKWTKPVVRERRESEMTSSAQVQSSAADSTTAAKENEVNLQDFAEIFQQWRNSIKQTIYDFMSRDVSKENILGILRFLGLLLVSLLSGAFMGVKFLGSFALRFMFEMSRFTHAATPILLKIIDLFQKIVGGFYLLLAMIWKDAVVNRNRTAPSAPALEYNRPMYKSIQYEVRQRRISRPIGSPIVTEVE